MPIETDNVRVQVVIEMDAPRDVLDNIDEDAMLDTLEQTVSGMLSEGSPFVRYPTILIN